MRRAVALGATFAVLLAVSLVASAGARTATATTPGDTLVPPIAEQLPEHQVSYCHRTDSIIKPYVLLTTDADAIIQRGHGSHTGPVFPETGPGQNGKWGDVIPPFDYDNGQEHFDGLNWDSGQDVLIAGCAVHETIEPPPGGGEGSTTTTPGQTTPDQTTPDQTTPDQTTPGQTTPDETTPGQTTTTGPFTGSGTPTTVGGATTTTSAAVVSSSTTTTALPTTGTPPPTAAPTPQDPPPVDALAPGQVLSEPPPPILAFVIVPGSRLVALGVLSPQQVRNLYRELARRRLAHTGSASGELLAVALLTLLCGAALVGVSARPRRRPT